MKITFDFKNITSTEFGVGSDSGGTRAFSFVPVDVKVQDALREMAYETVREMQQSTQTPAKYEPSEKYGSIDYIYSPLKDDFGSALRDLHTSNNLPVNAAALATPTQIFCYFVRFIDQNGQRLTALRRATQFKGILKNRLVRLVTNALKIIEDDVFKLDIDFDLLIDANNIHILRPSGFEFVGQLQASILAAVPENIKTLQKDIAFVDFTGIQDFAGKHPRAARYLASIRSQKETANLDKKKLVSLCKTTNVSITQANGKIVIDDGHVMGFLEVLDRRRYEVELVRGSPERYRAPSRQRLKAPTKGDGQ